MNLRDTLFLSLGRCALSSSIITLMVPRAEKESVFLQYAVQAAVQAYRNDHKKKSDEVNADSGQDERCGDKLGLGGLSKTRMR